jgi:transposase-like protein
MIAMRKQHSPTFKAEVVREILREQKTIAQIASEYGVHPTLLYQWRDTALQALPTAFSDQSAKEQAAKEAAYQQLIDQLYREVGKLTTQLNWLKKKAGHLADEMPT